MTSGMQAAPTVAQRSQYHHYVPRFILRNYTDPNQQPVVNTGNKKQDKNKQRRIRQTRDFMLNVVNLQDVELEQQPLSQTFGVTDMYRDFDTSKPDQHYLEKELSKLESRAGEIIANVRKAFDAGKGQVELLRGERNDLRKFLFIMLYRNRMFQSRFNISMEEYSANDRKEMLAYMKEKNFTRPIDVWFSNIRAFLELKIVAQEDWMEKITSQAYPPDAIWFFKYMQMSFLSFCTPEVPEDEFLLTQNAYSIYEGCTSELAWTDFHNFAPVSPRLIIVLRSFLLPSGFDEHESERLKFLEMSNSMHSNPEKVRSVLVDLPVTKALNNYSKIVDRKHVLLPTKIRPENHKFYFKFFPISTAHAQKINSIMLEEALGTSALVYKTSSSLRRAVEAYFEDSNFKTMVKVPPVIESLLSGFATMKLPGLGVYYKWTDTHGIPYLNTLNQIAKRLGSTSVAKYVILDPNSSKKDFTNNDDFTKRYMRLGKLPAISRNTLLEANNPGGRDPKKLTKEMHQAQLMWKMTYKIDSAMRYQSDECKATIRENRARFFCEFPPYRVWLYLKIVRDAATRGPNQNIPPHIDPDVGGLEDVYADGMTLFYTQFGHTC